MLAGTTYQEAKSEIGNEFYSNYGIDTDPLLAALRAHGFSLLRKGRLSQTFTVEKLQENALLHGKLLPTRGHIRPDMNTYSHWVVWDAHEQVVRDPYRFKKPLWLTSFYELGAPK